MSVPVKEMEFLTQLTKETAKDSASGLEWGRDDIFPAMQRHARCPDLFDQRFATRMSLSKSGGPNGFSTFPGK
jgi:hypothetical protein